jgi:hypothetical protein
MNFDIHLFPLYISSVFDLTRNKKSKFDAVVRNRLERNRWLENRKRTISARENDMATQKRRYHPKKWAGVYVYETTKCTRSPDLCFYINFRSGRRLIWEKVGRISEG